MAKNKRILIATGGTGGHIYPATAFAQKVMQEHPGCQMLFVGGGLTKNRYFDSSAFDFREISCGTFTSKNPLVLAQACVKIAKGIRQSSKIIDAFKPDVAVGFGSYYSFPPMVAAQLRQVPTVLHEGNSIPGKVNKLLALWATAIGVHFPQTVSLLKGKGVEVGMPLRRGFQRGCVSKSEARKYFGLEGDRPTLLIFGGSQGAQAINVKVQAALKLMENKKIQVIHLAGDELLARDTQQGYAQLGINACVKPFEKRMDIAWQAADMVICRAGAGTVAELFEFEVPGILIPFPRAADNHQEYNADFIVETVGGGRKYQEAKLDDRLLANVITDYLDEAGAKLAKMRHAMEEYKKNSRTQDLTSLVMKVMGEI